MTKKKLGRPKKYQGWRPKMWQRLKDSRQAILKLGCRFQGVTSSDVREVLGIRERRARQIIQHLEEQGDLIRTPNVRDQPRGRPPVIYRTNPDIVKEILK